jgi:CheY-like chemotaxis protein
MKILLVEDSDINAQVFIDCIEPLNAKVVRTTSIKDSANEINDNGFDLVVLDLNVDDSKGIKTIEQVRAIETRIPILLYSGLVEDDVIKAMPVYGISGILMKGEIGPQQIMTEIKRAIAQHQHIIEWQESQRAKIQEARQSISNG